MQEQVADFISRYEEFVLPLDRALEAAIKHDGEGSSAALKLREELRVHLRNRDAFTRIRVYADAAVANPLTRQQAQHLYRIYLRHQREPGLREKIRQAVAAVQDAQGGFRWTVDGGPPAGLGQIWSVFNGPPARENRREAWAQIVALAESLAPLVLEVVALRNRAARDLGFRDHHQMDLAIRDLAHREVWPLIEGLAAATQPRFKTFKRALNRDLAAAFKTRQHLLRPWHFADPYRVIPPEFGLTPGRGRRRDALAAARTVLGGLGLDVPDDAIASALDDATEDTPVLLDDPGEGYAELRELAGTLRALARPVFDHHLPSDLPPLLRRPTHALVVCALGDLLAYEVEDPDFLIAARRMRAQHAGQARVQLQERERRELLLLARFAPALVRFERELYRDPGQDLAGLWWDLMGDALDLYPAGRREPIWAAMPGIVDGPGVLCERLLGTLASAQLRETLSGMNDEARGLLSIDGAGEFLRTRLIAPGASLDWRVLIESATGRPLGPEAFLSAVGV